MEGALRHGNCRRGVIAATGVQPIRRPANSCPPASGSRRASRAMDDLQRGKDRLPWSIAYILLGPAALGLLLGLEIRFGLLHALLSRIGIQPITADANRSFRRLPQSEISLLNRSTNWTIMTTGPSQRNGPAHHSWRDQHHRTLALHKGRPPCAEPPITAGRPSRAPRSSIHFLPPVTLRRNPSPSPTATSPRAVLPNLRRIHRTKVHPASSKLPSPNPDRLFCATRKNLSTRRCSRAFRSSNRPRTVCSASRGTMEAYP